MKTPPPAEIGRAERTVAYMLVAIIGVSVLAVVALLVAMGFGTSFGTSPLGLVLLVLPLIGLPVGFILIIVMMVLGARRRRR
ncbi:hypothetical protein HQQ80_21260 [Microbacteriaceae bacterium VKM Ac-2855]|nr:hypothetical protein [Microbacteriaceae bacterium VKM Ac-2855]